MTIQIIKHSFRCHNKIYEFIKGHKVEAFQKPAQKTYQSFVLSLVLDDILFYATFLLDISAVFNLSNSIDWREERSILKLTAEEQELTFRTLNNLLRPKIGFSTFQYVSDDWNFLWRL